MTIPSPKAMTDQARPDGELVEQTFREAVADIIFALQRGGVTPNMVRRGEWDGPLAHLIARHRISSERIAPQPDTERAQIVAWLRQPGHGYPDAHPFRQRIARQIERGDHLASLTPSKEGE